MKNKTILNVISTIIMAGLLVLTACPNPGDGDDDGGDKGSTVYSYRFGDIAEEMGFPIPANGIVLDDLMHDTNGMTYAEMIEAGNIPRLYKDKALTQPFTGTDILDANTMIYCARDLFGHDDGGGGSYYGDKIGEITGTITLTDIPNPAPKVEIGVSSENGNWSSNYNNITISGNNTTQIVNWSLSIYSPYDNFIASNGNFYLRVTPSGSNEGYQINIPATPYIENANYNNVDLGTVSLKTITLSGTINVKYNGNVVPNVVIAAVNYTPGAYLGSTELKNPANGATWSITIPALSSPLTDVHFRVEGSDATNNPLFYKELENPVVSVYDSNVGNINLNADVRIITLSGTINATYNNQPVPNVNIEAYGYDNGGEEHWFGNVYLEPTGSATPWSMQLREINSSYLVKFRVQGRTVDGREIFYRNNLFSPTVTVNSSSSLVISGITIDVGNITAVVLSGTINITCNNQPVSNVQITAIDNETDNDIGYANIESPAANAPWSIILPESNSSSQVRFKVNGDYNGWYFNKEIPDPIVNINSPSGISLNVSINSITVSGTINVTCNNQTVESVNITAYYVNFPDQYVGSTYIESPANGATWSMTLPTFSSPTQIYFRVNGSSKNGGYFSKIISSPRPTVSNVDVSNLYLNIGNVRLITMSGTVNFTNNGEPVHDIYIEVIDNNDGKYLASASLYDYPASGASWSAILPELDSSVQVKFKVRGNSANWNMLFYKEISGPTLAVNNADVTGLSLNLGNITPITLSGTINVNYNGQPVPHVRIEARINNLWIGYYSTELVYPSDEASWFITIPALSPSTEVNFTVNCYDKETYSLYIDRPAITVSDSTSGITIDLGDIASP